MILIVVTGRLLSTTSYLGRTLPAVVQYGSRPSISTRHSHAALPRRQPPLSGAAPLPQDAGVGHVFGLPAHRWHPDPHGAGWVERAEIGHVFDPRTPHRQAPRYPERARYSALDLREYRDGPGRSWRSTPVLDQHHNLDEGGAGMTRAKDKTAKVQTAEDRLIYWLTRVATFSNDSWLAQEARHEHIALTGSEPDLAS